MALTQIDDRGLKTPIDLLDNEKIRLGTGNDLELYHDGSDSYIDDSGTGALTLRGSATYIQKYTGEDCAKFMADGAVELYHDNSLKFATNTGGANVTGGLNVSGNLHCTADGGKIISGAGDDLQIYHDGSHAYVDSSTGNLYLESQNTISIRPKDGENGVKILHDGAVELYYDNVKTLVTGGDGITVLGPEGGNATLRLSADEGDDNADLWKWQAKAAGGIQLENYASGSWEDNIVAYGNGSVELYHNNSKVFETLGNGVRAQGGIMFGSDTADDNRLTDYENGTWTPTVAGSPTDLSVSGEYRKVGKMVSFNGFVSLTSHSNSSTTHIGGLPFSGMSGKTFSVTVGNYRYLNLDGGYTQFMIDMAGTTMTLREQGDNTNYQNISWDQISNDFQVYFSGVYYTD